MNPLETVCEVEKVPADHRTPPVESMVELAPEPYAMKAPVSVPLPVMLKEAGELKTLRPLAAAPKGAVGRGAAYVGAFVPPASNQPG